MDWIFIKKPPVYFIDDDDDHEMVYVKYPGSEVQPTCMSLRNFRIAHGAAGQLLAEHDHSRRTSVARFPKRERG